MPDYVANEPGFYIPDRHLRAPELLIPGRGIPGYGAVEIDWDYPVRGLAQGALLEAHINGKRYTRYADDSSANTSRYLSGGRFATYSQHAGNGWVWSGKDIEGMAGFYIDNLSNAENFIRLHYRWISNTDNGGYRIYLNTDGTMSHNARNNSSDAAEALTNSLSVGDHIVVRWITQASGYAQVSVLDATDLTLPTVMYDAFTFSGRYDGMAGSTTQMGGLSAQCKWAFVFDESRVGWTTTQLREFCLDPFVFVKPIGT